MKAMSANVREAVTEVVDRMTQYISSEGSGVRINLFQWTGKAKYVCLTVSAALLDQLIKVALAWQSSDERYVNI